MVHLPGFDQDMYGLAISVNIIHFPSIRFYIIVVLHELFLLGVLFWYVGSSFLPGQVLES